MVKNNVVDGLSCIGTKIQNQRCESCVLKLALNQMAMTCSDVTTIDGSDVQQMSQMADLNGPDSVSMSPPSPPSSRSLVSVI
jgi:hypothetical protein